MDGIEQYMITEHVEERWAERGSDESIHDALILLMRMRASWVTISIIAMTIAKLCLLPIIDSDESRPS